MNNKGAITIQGVLLSVVIILFLVFITPVLVVAMDTLKGSDYLNCQGFVDPNEAVLGTANQSYDPNISTNVLGCVGGANLYVSMFVVICLFGILAHILTKGSGSNQMMSPQGY